ncbi:MAG: DUF4145 domain-containing protein [Syntrophobacteraceae bacterium]
MFKDKDDLRQYVIENYPYVTDARVDDDHWDLQCTYCKVTRGFQLIKLEVGGHVSRQYRQFVRDFDAPVTFLFRCPVCKAFKQWIVYVFSVYDREKDADSTHYFRVTSVPSEGLEDIDELPEDPPSLRTAYRQAIRAKDANAHLAAAAMFRRALQVITRDLIGANPGNLAIELNQIVGKSYNGVTITSNFAANAYIVKEAGNQGAHPDKDPDLLDFEPQDAEDLQLIFMELVSEIFVVPAAIRKTKADFLARRKITTKP